MTDKTVLATLNVALEDAPLVRWLSKDRTLREYKPALVAVVVHDPERGDLELAPQAPEATPLLPQSKVSYATVPSRDDGPDAYKVVVAGFFGLRADEAVFQRLGAQGGRVDYRLAFRNAAGDEARPGADYEVLRAPAATLKIIGGAKPS